VASLVWRASAAISSRDDRCRVDPGERLGSRALDYLPEDTLAPLPRSERERRPGRSLTVAGNEPRERASRLALGLWACRSGQRGLVLRVELGSAERCADANTAAAANADVPRNAAVSGDLTLQVRRPRAGHGRHYKTMCSDFSRDVASPVDSRTMICA